MKHADVQLGTCISYSLEGNDKVPKFKVGLCVRTSNYKNIFPRVYTPNWF